MTIKGSATTHDVALQHLEESLGNVWLAAELLNAEGRELPSATRADYLRFISSTSAELSQLVADLALLSSYETRTATLNCTRLTISELVLQCMEGLHALSDARAVEVCLLSSGREAQVEGDYWKLSQAISALLEDVLRNTSPGGRVEMEVLSIPKAVRLVLRSSESVPSGQRGGVARLLGSDQAKGESLLRVPLAREIVDLHRGLISGAAGEQRFIVVLPAAV